MGIIDKKVLLFKKSLEEEMKLKKCFLCRRSAYKRDKKKNLMVFGLIHDV
jgi:hypothetical protein